VSMARQLDEGWLQSKPDRLFRAFSLSPFPLPPFPFSGKMTLSLDVSDQSPDRTEANRPLPPELRMKGMALDAIHDDLVRTFGKDAVAYSMVSKYVHSAQFPAENKPPSRSSTCGMQSCR
jgi:hypothetical protein